MASARLANDGDALLQMLDEPRQRETNGEIDQRHKEVHLDRAVVVLAGDLGGL